MTCNFVGCERARRSVRYGLCQTHDRQRRLGQELRAIGPRGFADMAKASRESFLELCSAAGRRAHALGKAHEFQAGAEASAAGRVGGTQAQRKRASKS